MFDCAIPLLLDFPVALEAQTPQQDPEEETTSVTEIVFTWLGNSRFIGKLSYRKSVKENDVYM